MVPMAGHLPCQSNFPFYPKACELKIGFQVGVCSGTMTFLLGWLFWSLLASPLPFLLLPFPFLCLPSVDVY
jgi:hypothetical protein